MRQHCGAPTVFLNGAPFYFGAVGYRLPPFPIPSLGVVEPNAVWHYDETPLVGLNPLEQAKRIENHFVDLFAANPNAVGACHLWVAPDRSWVERFPDDAYYYETEIDWKRAVYIVPALGSTRWQEDSAKTVHSICSYLHERFQGRIVLYQYGTGACAENVVVVDPMGTGESLAGDFNPQTLNAFRKFCSEFNHRDTPEPGRRNEWQRRIAIPDTFDRVKSDYFSFRTEKTAWVADYFRYTANQLDKWVVMIAEEIKKATNSESLTASPIGALLDTGLNSQMTGALSKCSFSEARRCDCLDFLQSPASYAYRDLGEGDTSAMIPLGTVRLAGKAWLRDFDSRTSLVREQHLHHPVARLWRFPENAWQDRQTLLRDAAYSIVKGGAWWWHEINPPMYSLPEHVEAVRSINRIADFSLETDRSIPAGLGILVDENSYFEQAGSSRLSYAMNYESRQLNWFHCGMAAEAYLAEDVTNGGFPLHRVILATNLFAASDAVLESIIHHAKRVNGVVVWLVAPGLQTSGTIDLGRTARYTGMKVIATECEAYPGIFIDWTDHPLGSFLPDATERPGEFGGGVSGVDDGGSRTMSPLFWVDCEGDPDVTVLGKGKVLNKPAFAMKQMDGWTSVYCAAPSIPGALLRALGHMCSSHVFIETDDMLHCSKELLVLCAKKSGRKTLTLPQDAEVIVDLVSGNTLGRDTNRVSVELRQFETLFIYYGALTSAVAGFISNLNKTVSAPGARRTRRKQK
jgi:hypothetical protein